MKKIQISAICFDMWGTLCEGGGQKQWDDLQAILGANSVDKKTFLKLGEENLLMHPWPLRDGIKNLANKLTDIKHHSSSVILSEAKDLIIEKAYNIWWEYVQKSKPYPEVEAVLDKLEQLKIRKFIISNTDVEAFDFKIKTLGWNKYFEKFFLSAEIGTLKPNIKIFQAVQDYLQLPKKQILMVDDSLQHGVSPARSFGWKALWIAREKNSINVEKIQNLREIFPIMLPIHRSNV